MVNILFIGGEAMNREEFIDEIEDILRRIRNEIEKNHEFSFAAPYNDEMNQYTFKFTDEEGYSQQVANEFLNHIRELALHTYDLLVKEKIDENPNPTVVVTTVLQYLAHKIEESRK